MAPKLIQDFYKLFLFRLNVQEPRPEVRFFENEKIDPDTMKELWNNDEIDQLCVARNLLFSCSGSRFKFFG